MSLVVTWVVVSLATAVVLWGLSLFLQAYLYNEPADKLVLRAAVGGLAVGGFVTFWVFVNTRADRENKYGAIHQFSPEGRTEAGGFEAELKYKTAAGETKKTVAYKKPAGEVGQRYVDADGKPFRTNSADHITTALIVSEGQPAPVRFEAVLKNEWTYDGEKKVFREKGTSRYVESDEPGVVFAPSFGTQVIAVAINLLAFVVLFAVFWLGLRFALWHAAGLAVVFGLPLVLVLMPMLFDKNKLPKAAGVPSTASSKP